MLNKSSRKWEQDLGGGINGSFNYQGGSVSAAEGARLDLLALDFTSCIQSCSSETPNGFSRVTVATGEAGNADWIVAFKPATAGNREELNPGTVSTWDGRSGL